MRSFYLHNGHLLPLLLLKAGPGRKRVTIITIFILLLSSPSITSFQHFRNRNYSLISKLSSRLDPNYYYHHHDIHYNKQQQLHYHDQLSSLTINHCNTSTHSIILRIRPPVYAQARTPVTKLFAKRQRNNLKNDSDNKADDDTTTLSSIIQPFESIFKFLLTPIPNNTSSPYSIPLLYPLLIIGLNLVLDSLTTVLLLDFFFVLFYTFARSVIIMQEDYDDDVDGYHGGIDGIVDDDVDDNDRFFNLNSKVLDLVALSGSIVSAGLVSPTGLSIVTDDMGLGENIGLILLLLCSSFGVVNLLYGIGDGYNDSNDNGHNVRNKVKDKNGDDFSSDLFSDWDRKFRDIE